jgi:hypothetical protein
MKNKNNKMPSPKGDADAERFELERSSSASPVDVEDERLLTAAHVVSKKVPRIEGDQAEFWAKVGRAVLDNPDLPAAFVISSLMSLEESHEDGSPFVARSLCDGDS